MTRAEMRARAFHRLAEDPDSPAFWSTAQMDRALDDAAEVVAEEARAIRRTVFLALDGQCGHYRTTALAPDVMAIWRLWSLTTGDRLTATTLDDLDRRHDRWARVTGEPEVWYPLGSDAFGIWPVPAQGGGVLRADILAWPRALLDDEDRPEFLDADHEALVDHAVVDGHLKRWNPKAAVDVYATFMARWTDAVARTAQRGRGAFTRSDAR